MRAIAADFRTGEQDLKPEMLFDLFAKFVQRLAEKFFHFAAPQANDMRVLLLQARLVEVLVAADVHQVEFVDKTTRLQHLEGAIDSDTVQLRILLLRHQIQPFGVQVLTGFVDQIEQNLSLPGKAYTAFFQ